MLCTTTKGDDLFHFSKVTISLFQEERDIAHQCVMKKETASTKVKENAWDNIKFSK